MRSRQIRKGKKKVWEAKGKSRGGEGFSSRAKRDTPQMPSWGAEQAKQKGMAARWTSLQHARSLGRGGDGASEWGVNRGHGQKKK